VPYRDLTSITIIAYRRNFCIASGHVIEPRYRVPHQLTANSEKN
jgi:hypothetical protein